MCKESSVGYVCPRCGQRIVWAKLHFRHCIMRNVRVLREREKAAPRREALPATIGTAA